MTKKTVLVAGGAGFIGSHTVKLLARQGYEPVVYDNLSTGHLASIRWGDFVEGDILDTRLLIDTIEEHDPAAVIHFAASAYVGESVENPAQYYQNNVSGTQSFARGMPQNRRTQCDFLFQLCDLRDSFVDFRVTPKGAADVDPLPLRVLAPYGFLAITSIMPVLLIPDASDESRGFYIFAIINALIYTVLLFVIVVQHAGENTVRYKTRIYRPALAASLVALVALPALASVERGREGIEALAWGTRSFSLFDDRFAVAGAGVGGRSIRQSIFNPRWRTDAGNNSNRK